VGTAASVTIKEKMECDVMETDPKTGSPQTVPEVSQAAANVAEAHELLKAVSEKHGLLEKHPELAEVITKLELALNDLTLETGGML
jgi:hypothetical protein